MAAGGCLAENSEAVAFYDRFPASQGHALIVSRRHVSDLFELTDDERHGLWALLPDVKAIVEQAHSPAGFNVGVNVGAAAGQTVMHVHLHLIPRYPGDVPYPRGGVRWVVPHRAAVPAAVVMANRHDHLALAERTIGILNEGSFSATYKFALFIAILDLCIEKSEKGNPPTSLTTRELAQKVLELYWNQVTPYPGVGVLRFGGGRGEQAEIVTRIVRLRERFPNCDPRLGARAADRSMVRDYAGLLNFVEWKLIEMPIPRLQVLGRDEVPFLYRYDWTKDIKRSTVAAYQAKRLGIFNNELHLLPEVGEGLVALNGILRPLFYRDWAVLVARMNGLPEAQLEEFLFGSRRIPLEAVRAPLVGLQQHRCFYCQDLMSDVDVDHFIPRTRYPDDSLDNLVASHSKCNNSKRDYLAALSHLENWLTRSKDKFGELQQLAIRLRWPRDLTRSRSVASAIYCRLPAGTRLWVGQGVFTAIDRAEILRTLELAHDA